MTEQLLPLTTEERAELEKHKIVNARGCVWLLGALFGIIVITLAGFSLFIWQDVSWRKQPLPIGFWYLIVALVVTTILALFVMPLAYRKWGNPAPDPATVKDLIGGLKRVVRETVTHQTMESSENLPRMDGRHPARSLANADYSVLIRYLIVVGDKTLEVTEESYYRVKAGDEIETHLAPNSGRVFSRRNAATGELIQLVRE